MKYLFFLISFFFQSGVSSQQLTVFNKYNLLFGYKDSKTGKEIVPAKYTYVSFNTSAGFYKVYLGGKHDNRNRFSGGKWGLLDSTGKEFLEPKYNYLSSFSEGLAIVNIGGEQDDQTIVVCIKDKYGFINKSGKLEIPLKFDYALPFSEGLAAVGKGSDIAEGYKWGFIDRTGKLIIPFQYDEVSSFKNGKVSVTVGDEYFKIDKNGKKIE